MLFNLPQVPSSRRLVTSETSEPKLKIPERCHQRLYFSKMAASTRVCPVQNTQCVFLCGHAHFRGNVYQIHIPGGADSVAIGVCVLKVITRIQEQNRNIPHPSANHVQDHHVFRLETACNAGAPRMFSQYTVKQSFCGQGLSGIGKLCAHWISSRSGCS